MCLTLTAGISLGVQIHQSPSAVIRNTGDNVQLVCTHGQSDYRVMLWYQQSPGDKALKLIGYGYTQFKNDRFKSGFQAVRSKEKQSSLTITNVQTKDEAVYLCAASLHTYFGKGTKLTVLEKDKEITEPTVEVLRPSPTECRNEQRNKTLVCVATGFYPDHVSISWQISGVGVTKGVATDEAAQWMPGKTFYQITSRLKVSEEDWYNPKNQFNCTVNFYNGNDTVPYTDSIRGEGIVFIVKSCIYGAFVVFLVWKLQVCSTQCSM
uniref:Ig-like domain-containing protein n=1 Tax=Dicentrarchus labrax TaxID=13489 RepID=A0A8C4ETA0_DICLA